MPTPRKPARKVAVTVKLPVEFAAELREWVKRERGRPLFVESLSAFAEQALRREMARLNLVVSVGSALPLGRNTNMEDGEGKGTCPNRRPINSSKS